MSWGLNQVIIMSFGLRNAGAMLKQALDLLMTSLSWEEDIIYIDDLIILAANIDVFLL